VAVTGTNGIPAGPVFSLAEGADGTLWLANFNGLIRLKGREWQRFEYTDGWFGGGRFPMKVDASGTLWSGGGGGVSRFDGHSFITYRTSDGLSLDRVEALEQDHEGVWWFGTFGGGLSRFDEHHGFRLFTGAAGLPANYVTSLAEDKQARSGPR
jgi:ligand-binding sensor domain-containing protein